MIRTWARRYRSTACDVPELIQEGNLGLLDALERFDARRDVRLSTFASWYVRASMLRFVERNRGVVRGATTAARRRLFYQLARTQQTLAQAGVTPTRAELAAVLDAREDDVYAMQNLQHGALSFETAARDGGRATMDRLEDPSSSPEQSVASDELASVLRHELERFATTLSTPARAMLEEYVASTQPTSLAAFGARWGLSNSATRRLADKVSTPLKRHLYRTMGDAIVETLGHR